MIFVGYYDEFCPGMGYPSVKDCVSEKEHPYKLQILQYLKSGDVHMVTAAFVKDVFTGNPRSGGLLYHMNDGVYAWTSRMPYYFEKYNLILPEDFINHILSKTVSETKAN